MHHINISYFWNNKDSKNQLYQQAFLKSYFPKLNRSQILALKKKKQNIESSAKKTKTFDGINVSKFTNI